MVPAGELKPCPQIQKPFGTKNCGDIGVMLGLYWGHIGFILGLYWDNGKEHGNYFGTFESVCVGCVDLTCADVFCAVDALRPGNMLKILRLGAVPVQAKLNCSGP